MVLLVREEREWVDGWKGREEGRSVGEEEEENIDSSCDDFVGLPSTVAPPRVLRVSERNAVVL